MPYYLAGALNNMTRYYPVLSECTLEDCGAYERFQVNHVQVWHRYPNGGNIIWIAVFENLDDFDEHVMASFGNYHHWYSIKDGLWYTNQAYMRKGLKPSVEEWYQDYLQYKQNNDN
jgi:hypothetical protein